MKTNLYVLAGLLVLSFTCLSQKTNNLVIFSEDGDPFYAYINGVKQNSSPETHVKFTGLSSSLSLRIEFEDTSLPQLKQIMVLDEGFEHTARIKRNAQKQLKLRYFGRVPLNEDTYYAAQDQNIYNTAPEENTVVGQHQCSPHATPSYIEKSQTTRSCSGNSYTTKTDKHYDSYPANNFRKVAMSTASFAKMKESVESKPFSDTKMTTAKIATKSNWLSVDQIKTIAKLFSMDDDKLAYAKYAFDYCVDKGNYYQVIDVFSFSSTTDEFNNFLEH